MKSLFFHQSRAPEQRKGAREIPQDSPGGAAVETKPFLLDYLQERATTQGGSVGLRDDFEGVEGDEDDFDRAHDGGSSGEFNGAGSFLPSEEDEALVVGRMDVIEQKGLEAISSSTLTHFVGGSEFEAGVE